MEVDSSSPSTAIVLIPAIRRTIPWPEAPAAYQNFSLPFSIIYYMAKNPLSPTVYSKLIQSSKYFFEVNPILVVADMFGHKLYICSNSECEGGGLCCIKIDFNSITSKFWLTHGLYLNFNVPENFIALLRPKIYCCDIKRL